MNPLPPPAPPRPAAAWLRNGLFLTLIAGGTAVAVDRLWSLHEIPPAAGSAPIAVSNPEANGAAVVESLNAAFAAEPSRAGFQPAPPAPTLTIVRRLSLALTGTLPSLEEIRALEARPEAERVSWWLDRLLADRRFSDYFAERFARVYVGVEDGPFLVFRRRRLVEWVSDAFQQNRPYDQIVRELIDSKGIWTTHPEVNFVTATVEPEKGPDKVKLASRVSRAFLGVRMDCVECHDDKLGGPWKQRDFHQLAAFFGRTETTFGGVQDNPKAQYEYRYLREKVAAPVPSVVPWSPEILPQNGPPRERLATWVTAPGNRPFARAVVNRVWALLFNKPLVEPVDNLPVHGPFPAALELLADDFTAHGCDLQRLIRLIAGSRIFQMDSRSPDAGHPPTEESEKSWSSFPLTRLRSGQMAGSVVQASSLSTLDAETHVVYRLKRMLNTSEFLKRYGDAGEEEFGSRGGTIPQRLLLMNGEVVQWHVKTNPVFNAATRIAWLAPDDATAIETAYLAVFTRRPTPEEAAYFLEDFKATPGKSRSDSLSDLYWTLMNSTEFSWNH